MTESAAHPPRPDTGANAWFGLIIASWTAFGLLAVTSEQTLAEAWDWIRRLLIAAAWTPMSIPRSARGHAEP